MQPVNSTRSTRPTRAPANKRPKPRQKDDLWSARVTRESDALDLEQGVFRHRDPRAVAISLRDSAEKSKRRKAEPYRSAMSMLVFYINRAGRNLPSPQRQVLERAKDELRRLYGRRERPPSTQRRSRSRRP